MRRLITLIILAALLSLAGSAAAQITVLNHATVIDGTGAGPQNDVAILMENGRIRDMGPSSKIPPPAGANVLDLTGKFIVPGIINAHGHVDAKREPQLRQYALYGVTTTTSMSFDNDDIVEFKAEQKRGNLGGARILTVKYRFMSAPSNPVPNTRPQKRPAPKSMRSSAKEPTSSKCGSTVRTASWLS